MYLQYYYDTYLTHLNPDLLSLEDISYLLTW